MTSFVSCASWLEKPLTVGAVAPSGKALARIMAGYIDPAAESPVVELGPGTGPVTEALVERGIDPARLILVEFDPQFCALLRERYPAATVVQGDAYSLRQTLAEVCAHKRRRSCPACRCSTSRSRCGSTCSIRPSA